MKRSTSVLSVIVALGVGFGGGYLTRGATVPDVSVSAAPAAVFSTRELPIETPAARVSAPTATPRPTAAPRPASTPSTYIINKNSRVFHVPSCSSVLDMNESNKIRKTNVLRETLMEDGYQRCTRCKP